ncbi:MAG: TolC family protein [Bacteroidales bacterium]|nr:TolC family protein [Bacteroidales bacterium]
MKIRSFLLLLVAVMSPVFLYAQQKEWSLEECIAHALENNIQIKQQEIVTQYQESALEQSKLDLLPSLNGSASHRYAFGRALDQTTNRYTENETVQSNSFSAGSNLSLFNGLTNLNTIRRNEYELLASEQDLKGFRDDVSLNVALAYLQILLNHELVNTTLAQVEMTQQQIDRTQKLVDAGSLARGNLLDIEAQAAREEVQLITLQNQLAISYLTLAQLLELPSAEGFAIQVPSISLDMATYEGSPDSIFKVAEKIRPEVLSAEYKLKGAEYDLAIAKGGRSPQLSLGASLGTSYSDNRIDINTLEPYDFWTQMDINRNASLGLSLNIPILNGWLVNTRIKNSKLGIENSKYTLENTRKQLYKNIQQAYTDAKGAMKKFYSSQKAVASMEEAFRYSEQKLNVGMLTAVDYNLSKTQLLNAQSEMAQAKYEYVFKTKVLDFYRGIPLTLEHITILANQSENQ